MSRWTVTQCDPPGTFALKRLVPMAISRSKLISVELAGPQQGGSGAMKKLLCPSGPEKVEVVTFPRPGHHSVLPESYGFGVPRNRDMTQSEDGHIKREPCSSKRD